jgi:hypothetical protein
VQRKQQQGDRPRVVEANVADGPSGQGGDRVVGSGLAQLPQQPTDGPRILEAYMIYGPVSGADGVAGADLAQEADEFAGGVGVAQGCCSALSRTSTAPR